MTRLVSILIGLLVAWFCIAASASAEVAPSEVATAPHHCESLVHASADQSSAPERGPPALTHTNTAPRLAVGTAPYGPSARRQTGLIYSYTTFDHQVRLAQSDGARVTTLAVPGASAGDVRVVSGWRCSAKTGARACSFAGATTVLMADGTRKRIEDIRVGDMVIATDPDTGEQVGKTVEHVFVHDDTVIDLIVDGEVITTTEDHPFWSVTDRRFERADGLSPGDMVLGADGRVITVDGLVFGTARETLAYNLSVEGIHTYHVGQAEILVHNECSDAAWDIANHAFDDHGAAMGFRNVDEMGAYVDDVMGSSAGHLRDDGSRFWVDYGNSAIIFRGPNAAVPGSVYRPDNFAHAVEVAMRRTVNEP